MQPNQQEPSAQNYQSLNSMQPQNPTSFSNAPGYLHLDPIPDIPVKRTKKKIFIMISLVIIVAVAIAAALLLTNWLSKANEQQFYGVLEKSLGTKYLGWKLTISQNNNTAIQISAKSDLSDVLQPKTDLDVFAKADATKKGTSPAIEGRLVMVGASEVYANYSSLPPSTSTAAIAANRWYKLPASSVEKGIGIVDIGAMRRVSNPVFGDILLGNFSSPDKTTLLNYISTQQPYVVADMSDAKMDGVDTTVFVVDTDSNEVGKLNGKAAEILKATIPESYKTSNAKNPSKLRLHIWVNKKDGKILKITSMYRSPSATSEYTYDLELSYPSGLSIEAPKQYNNY